MKLFLLGFGDELRNVNWESQSCSALDTKGNYFCSLARIIWPTKIMLDPLKEAAVYAISLIPIMCEFWAASKKNNAVLRQDHVLWYDEMPNFYKFFNQWRISAFATAALHFDLLKDQ